MQCHAVHVVQYHAQQCFAVPCPACIIMFTFMFIGSIPPSKQAQNCICCTTMAARSSSSCGLDDPPAKPLEVLQAIQSVGKQTKASTIKMLSLLQKPQPPVDHHRQSTTLHNSLSTTLLHNRHRQATTAQCFLWFCVSTTACRPPPPVDNTTQPPVNNTPAQPLPWVWALLLDNHRQSTTLHNRLSTPVVMMPGGCAHYYWIQ